MDGDNLDMAFEPGAENEGFEFVDVEDGAAIPEPAPEGPKEDPDKVTLDKVTYEELLKQKNSTDAMNQGLNKLADVLVTGQQAPMPMAPQVAPKSADEIERALFTPGKTAEEVKRLIREELAPLQGLTLQQQVENSRRFMKLAPETTELFTKYEKDIEQWVQKQPPQVRFRPDVYEMAYKEIILAKQNDIIQERANAIAEKAIQEALEKAGLSKPQGSKPPVAMPMESGSTGAAPRPKQKVFFTAEDRREMIRMSMDPADNDQRMAYYEKFIKGRSKK